jgi:DNA-directed RNA polymerase subunit RPC12/RpoP
MNQPDQKAPNYVACPCQYCSGKIEFDANKLDLTGATGKVLAGQTIACPHCGMETILFVPQRNLEPPKAESKPTSSQTQIPLVRKENSGQPNDSIRPLIAWGCAAFFAVTSILFACLYLSEKHSLQRTETALAMAENSEAELKSNVQATEAVAKDNVSELAAEGRQALSGIYFCQQVNYKNELDLRSDSSAVWLNDSSGQKLGASKWTTDGDTITVNESHFKIEGSDLIDSHGNRWLHIR